MRLRLRLVGWAFVYAIAAIAGRNVSVRWEGRERMVFLRLLPLHEVEDAEFDRLMPSYTLMTYVCAAVSVVSAVLVWVLA